MFKRNNLFLLIVIILGAILRFYKLGIVPDGFHTDEAYLGYNAFSILKTGNELTGNFLPLNLRSFLYSPAGYSYFSIPFIFLFGLSEFSARFASALFGTATIPIAYILVRKIFTRFNFKGLLALFSSLILAISPWHINLSRVSTDNVLVVFFVTLGTFLFLKWLDQKKLYLVLLSMLSFFITLFIYQASRSFLPIFIPLLFIYGLFLKKIKVKKFLLPLIVYMLLIIIPVLLILGSQELSFRIRTLSIFQNPSTQLLIDEQIREDGVIGISPSSSRFYHNKIINFSQTFFSNYFKHFSYEFLFTDAGLPDRYRVSEMGLFYIFELPLLLIGLWFLFRNDKKIGFLITGWILTAPIGSALTFDDVPNLQRTLLMFPAVSILSALGLITSFKYLRENIRNKNVWKAGYILIFLIIGYNFMFYLHVYYVNNIIHRPWYRSEGFRELVAKINLNLPGYSKAVIAESGSSPTIFLLFYNRYDPLTIQKIVEKANTIKYGSISFDKYQIVQDKCPVRMEKVVDKLTGKTENIFTGEKGVLFVNEGTCRTPDSANLIADIKRPDGTVAFKLLKVK
ncbi:MAG: hypothetical protein A2152_03375 [Candidatus Levybacteria bacterium RBG_16_35_6]|nr:MAG: hypothetical protein A2152_03375 [Candidatus Levybacteria bacterium RBG_16_35_6]